MTNDTPQTIIDDTCAAAPAQQDAVADARPQNKGFQSLYNCDAIGLRLERFHTPQFVRLVGFFAPVAKPGDTMPPPRDNQHLYEISVERRGPLGWVARATCDGRPLFMLTSDNRWTAEHGAVAALFRRLCHRLVGTRRNIAARAAAGKEGK